MSYDYKIKLPQFEGPFDLLLFFIERDEVDIYNIPIHTITQEFLDYIHQAEQLNIELASDFILFVSTLMRIKSKMLLPRREKDELGIEIDPRAELVDKLLEYKRFKEAAATLSALEAERMLHAKRGNLEKELRSIGIEQADGSEWQHITTYRLMHAFEKALKKLDDRINTPEHVVIKYNYSMDGQKKFLIDYFTINRRENFQKLLALSENRIHIIFTFLSLLELVQQNILDIKIGHERNNIIIEMHSESKRIAE